MEQLQNINITFYSVVILALGSLIFIFLRNRKESKTRKRTVFLITTGILIWLTIQALLAGNDFYMDTENGPFPEMILAIGPPLLLIIYLAIFQKDWVRKLPGKWMTFFHVIRVPIELVLYGLFLNKLIPEVMTFSGRNFDIFVGLSAPVMSMLFYSNTSIQKIWMQIWNIIGLMLLINIVFHGIFSTPIPMQLFGLDQPNIALLQYPFIWLPSFLVPCVLFFHIACLLQLFEKDKPGY